jgi:hypothetical protein
MVKCVEADCNNEQLKDKNYCRDCEEFVLSELEELKSNA